MKRTFYISTLGLCCCNNHTTEKTAYTNTVDTLQTISIDKQQLNIYIKDKSQHDQTDLLELCDQKLSTHRQSQRQLWKKLNRKLISFMKFLIFILTAFLTLNLYSQSVDILLKSEISNLPESEVFTTLEPITDTSEIKFVATISAKDKNKKSNIEFLFFEIRKEATKMGANCFKVKSFQRGGEKNETILILDCYFLDESTIKKNIENREKNVVYIFGREREDDNSTSFKINGVEKEIKSGTFYKIILKPNEKIKISKGGITGASVVLNWEKNKEPIFLSLSGFGLASLDKQPANGIGFTSGSIDRIINKSFGLLLTKLLKQGNDDNLY